MTTAKVRVRGVFWRDSRKGTQTNAQTRARGDWYIRYTDQHGKLRKERVGPRNLAIELYRKRKTEVREGRFFPRQRSPSSCSTRSQRTFLRTAASTRSRQSTTRPG